MASAHKAGAAEASADAASVPSAGMPAASSSVISSNAASTAEAFDSSADASTASNFLANTQVSSAAAASLVVVPTAQDVAPPGAQAQEDAILGRTLQGRSNGLSRCAMPAHRTTSAASAEQRAQPVHDAKAGWQRRDTQPATRKTPQVQVVCEAKAGSHRSKPRREEVDGRKGLREDVVEVKGRDMMTDKGERAQYEASGSHSRALGEAAKSAAQARAATTATAASHKAGRGKDAAQVPAKAKPGLAQARAAMDFGGSSSCSRRPANVAPCSAVRGTRASPTEQDQSLGVPIERGRAGAAQASDGWEPHEHLLGSCISASSGSHAPAASSQARQSECPRASAAAEVCWPKLPSGLQHQAPPPPPPPKPRPAPVAEAPRSAALWPSADPQASLLPPPPPKRAPPGPADSSRLASGHGYQLWDTPQMRLGAAPLPPASGPVLHLEAPRTAAGCHDQAERDEGCAEDEVVLIRGQPLLDDPESTEAASELDHLCAICLDPCRQPATLPCDHRFCGTCLMAWMAHCAGSAPQAGSEVECPKCRRAFRKGTVSWASETLPSASAAHSA